MSTCWSCTVIVEQGTKVCPFCGADQSQPVTFVNPHTPQPPTLKSFLHDWGFPISIIIAALGIVAGLYWHNFGEPAISPAARATAVTAKSLRDIREALSTYALSAKDCYPAALSSLGNRVNLPMQAAQDAGYRLEYRPKLFANEGIPRGFVILARPEKDTYPNLFIDETGVVRTTQENRSATPKDPYL